MNSISRQNRFFTAARCPTRCAGYFSIALVTFCCLAQTVPAFGTPFTAGDLVVVQTGATGSGTTLTSKGTASFLDEIPAAGGAMIQQLAMPTTASDLNNPLTIGGTAASEGELSLSANGQYLVVGGYDVGVGGTTQGMSTVGLIDSGGNFNTTTTTNALNGNNTRGATSVDGNEVWVTGPAGLVYATTGSSGANIDNNVNLRGLSIVPAAISPTGVTGLFASSNKTNLGVLQFTPSLPTTPIAKKNQGGQILPGMTTTTTPDTYGFFFVNSTTLFVADANLGIQEWTYGGSENPTWSNVATLAGSYVGLTGVANGNSVSLYATTGTSAAAGRVPGNSLISDLFSFTSGTTGPGTFGTPTTLAIATANSEFSGVAFAPVNSAVGYAAIDNSGSGNFNGNVITVSVPASYAGVGSEVVSNSADTTVGGGAENTVATILAGNNSGAFILGGGAAPVSMSWRNRTVAESPAGNATLLISDVVNLYGMSSAATGTANVPAVQTDPFVLQLTFDASEVGANASARIAAGNVFLAWLNPNGLGAGMPQWQNANMGDFGGTVSGPLSPPTFIGSFIAYVNSLDDNSNFPDFTQVYDASNIGTLTNDQLNEILGAWGVDPVNNDAWAVVNHNSEFAVVPEPSTLVLAIFGLLAGLGLAIRRRSVAATA